jgi:hypothetical protein
MAQGQLLRLVVASPSDVQVERNILPTVIEEINNSVAKDRGVRLDLARWETDAYPGFHPEGPQGLIDAILRIEDCDILIGIFWKLFGTPVKDARSGTEHEFCLAYESWQQQRRPQGDVHGGINTGAAPKKAWVAFATTTAEGPNGGEG